MTAYEIGQLASTFLGTVAILVRMGRYVTVDEYRVKVASLHEVINEQGKQIAVQAERIKRLDERGN